MDLGEINLSLLDANAALRKRNEQLERRVQEVLEANSRLKGELDVALREKFTAQGAIERMHRENYARLVESGSTAIKGQG